MAKPPPWRQFVEAQIQSWLKELEAEHPKRAMLEAALAQLPRLWEAEEFKPLREQLAEAGLDIPMV